MSYRFKKIFSFCLPFGLRFQLRPNKSGKLMPPHLLRCQGLAVDDYSFALGRLTERSGDPASGEAGAPSTFAQLGFQ